MTVGDGSGRGDAVGTGVAWTAAACGDQDGLEFVSF